MPYVIWALLFHMLQHYRGTLGIKCYHNLEKDNAHATQIALLFHTLQHDCGPLEIKS